MALNKTMTFDLELKPGGIPPIIHASQGDIGRMFKANIYWDGAAATSYVSGATVNLRGKKPDKTVFDYTATLAGSMVTFETTEQMTIISGPVECELVFSNDGDIIASANFVLIVEASPYDPNAISESEVQGLNAMIQAATPEAVDEWFENDAPTSTTFADAVKDATDAYLNEHGVTVPQVEVLGNDVYTLTNSVTNGNVELFDQSKTTDGYYPSSQGNGAGNLYPNANAGTTHFLYVRPFEKLVITPQTGGAHNVVFYDKDQNYSYGYVVNLTAGVPYTAVIDYSAHPNVYYCRIAFYLTEKSTFSVIGTPKTYSRFQPLKMNCLGDSITYGYIPDSGAQMANPYPSIVKSILGLSECRNYGISGSTLAVNSGNYSPMCVRYADMDDDADIILVFGGTNDYGRAVYTPSIGTISDNVNTTVYGALNILCDGLITKYPKAFIFLCTPLKRADKTGANAGGYTLEDVADAIRAVGLKYGMPVLDLNAKGGFYINNDTFKGQYGGNDRLHPNQLFDTEHLAPMIARFIDSNL